MSSPLVTCVCPTTAARAAWLPLVVECFRSQTYANKHLLVVSEDDSVLRLARAACLDALRVPPGLTLGAKRNLACEAARGELIAHFDDDDWSHPGRLADQVARLEASGRALTGYTQMKFTDGRNWWRFVSDRQWPLGTSLLFRRAWWQHNRFPDEQVASDNELILHAQAQRQVVTAPAGDRMVVRLHGTNLNRWLQDPPKSGWLRDATKFETLDPARDAVPAALANWPAPEAVAC